MAALPAAVTAQSVTSSLSQLLQDRVVLAGHSSKLYRCLNVANNVTPATAMDFEWSTADGADGNANSSKSSSSRRVKMKASSHVDYFQMRYKVQGLRPDLPMLAMTKSSRSKALQLVQNPLNPPQLQPGFNGLKSCPCVDLNTPEAAAAAVDFSRLCVAAPAAAATAAAASPRKKREGQEDAYVPYLPLELCWLLPLPAADWRELQLLPAFMYRINSLLRLQALQQQLRGLTATAAGSNTGGSSSSGGGAGDGALLPQPSLLMAAMTARAAREAFDMEGLEYLGDVVLKFLTTNYLLQVCAVVGNVCACVCVFLCV